MKQSHFISYDDIKHQRCLHIKKKHRNSFRFFYTLSFFLQLQTLYQRMTSVFVFGILKVLLVIVILVAMVVIILGIGIATHRMEDTDNHATAEMREDISDRVDVIGRHSVFRNFLNRPVSRHEKHKVRQ